MNILVTGGLGFIGSHTVIELLNKHYNVIIIDNLYNSSIDVLELIKQITNKQPQFYNINLTDISELFTLQLPKIDAIIHFAAYKSVGESNKEPIKYYHNNIVSLLNIIKFADNINCKNIIFSSSATVYSSFNTIPFIENGPAGCNNNRYNTILTGNNPYSTTKIIGEQILHDLAASDSSWKIICLRYFNPVGCHPSGLLGENFKTNNIYSNLFPTIMNCLYYNKPLTIFGNNYNTSDKTAIRDYIHVIDVAIAHITALENMKYGCNVYNIGIGKGLSVLDIINEFITQNCYITHLFGDRRDGDLEIMYANNNKLLNELHWKPKYTLYDMVKDTINYYNKNK
jgi:UDP-glucose 4-epimerase